MMQKKAAVILFGILFSLLFVNIALAANESFSVDKSYSWLVSQQDTTGCFSKGSCDVQKTALSILALNKGGYATNIEDAAVWLTGQQDTTGCFPKGTCTVKSTSLAILALKSANKDITKPLSWLTGAEQAASTDAGSWWLQVIATSGTCKISYEGLATPQTITITDGKFTDCNNNYWFNLKDCVTGTPLKTKPSQKFSIDCSAIGNPKISLIYNKGDKYYLLKEKTGSIEINVDNGCWGLTKATACSYEPTWYASYALKEAGEDVSSIIWLRDNYQASEALYNSFMSLLTDKATYLEALKGLQQTDGSWSKNVQQTAIVLLALQRSTSLTTYSDVNTKAVNWLKIKQDTEGSWNKDVLDTAYVLYGLQTRPSGEAICGDGYCDSSESESSCSKDCKPSIGGADIEDCSNLIDDDGDGDADCDDSDCDYDIACEEGGATIVAPDKESDCKDKLDNDEDGDIDCEDSDCAEDSACAEGGAFGWILTIIISILLGVGGYFAYKKGFLSPAIDTIKRMFKRKTKPSAPEKQPIYRPQPAARPVQRVQPKPMPKPRRKEEDELSKSIEEARKLMGLK